MRVFKHPCANRSLRALDLKALGDGHASRDNPMFIEGPVRFREESETGAKVSGGDGRGRRYIAQRSWRD